MTTLDSGLRLDRLRRFGWNHPEWTWGLVAVAAWVIAWTAGHAGLGQPYPHWLVMMVAMMLPPALPMIRYVALAGRWRRRHANAAIFVGGFLLAWAAAGAVILTAVLVVRSTLLRAELAGPAPVPAGLLPASLIPAGLVPGGLIPPDVAASVLIGWSRWGVPAAMAIAAGWELTAVKSRFLRRCHWFDALPPRGWRAGAACLRFGTRYGWRSVGAGWALMLPMAVAPHTAFALMPLLAGIVAAEELLAKGARLTRAAAAALLGVAALMAGGS